MIQRRRVFQRACNQEAATRPTSAKPGPGEWLNRFNSTANERTQPIEFQFSLWSAKEVPPPRARSIQSAVLPVDGLTIAHGDAIDSAVLAVFDHRGPAGSDMGLKIQILSGEKLAARGRECPLKPTMHDIREV